MLEKYKFNFQIWSLIVFLIVMIPNFIWFIIPAPNDILRVTSITPKVDLIASVFQVIMVAVLCVINNKTVDNIGFSKWIIACISSCVLYYISWILYYLGITNAIIILGLTIPPCLVFLFYAIDRKNYLAIGPAIIFLACHLVYGIANYIIC